MSVEVVILAAGQGKRMRSALPKVLHPLGGKPMLARVIDVARSVRPTAIHVVISPDHPQIPVVIDDPDISWVEQPVARGTGDAVRHALRKTQDASNLLVLYGDVPLVCERSLQNLLVSVPSGALGVMTVQMPNPRGLGRIVRDQRNRVVAVREEKDASARELEIDEINTGIMLLPAQHVRRWLGALQSNNSQGEFYLTDVVAMAVAEEVPVVTTQPESYQDVGGINDRVQLAAAERIWQRRACEALMRNGVTIHDPARVDIRGSLTVGQDSVIDVNTVFVGTVQIGERVRIGPHCMIKDTVIGDDTVVESNTVVDGAHIGREVNLGPFARLRPGTVLSDKVHIGNFVEAKKTSIGVGSKANHLAYLGDTTIGSGCNVGAGTITCNYDGVNKHPTNIGDGVFVGSNATLVAPLTLENGAFIAAGSTITDKVPVQQLGVARSKQRNIQGWKTPLQRANGKKGEDD